MECLLSASCPSGMFQPKQPQCVASWSLYDARIIKQTNKKQIPRWINIQLELMIWALKENKRNHSREKKPGGLTEIWRWCYPGREEGGFWVENSLWEGGACSVVQGTQVKASAGALQTKARYCCRGQPSTTQSLVSWDGGSVFYMKCSEKSAKDWTCPCLDVWFHGWWVKITPSLMVKADMERQEKW